MTIPQENTSKLKPGQPSHTVDPNAKMQGIDVDAWFGQKQVLKTVNLTVKPNSVTAIIGPSGCGKSTFLRCFNPCTN
jgi:ABC-type phosphate transport system ATPase subunit